MGTNFLHLPAGKIHYRKWGRGNRLLLAWHGYGADAGMFEKLSPTLDDVFTIYAIDLPFHGQTQWKKASYHIKDLAAVFELILKKENANHCSLLGYSFGARIAMKLTKQFGNHIDTLYLLSPDGIRTRWLWTGYLIPRFLRRFLLKKLNTPDRLLRFAIRLRNWGLIPFFVEWFLRKNIVTPESRARLLGTWLSLNAFAIRKGRLKSTIKKHAIKVVVMIGERDKMLNQRAIQRFIQKLPDTKFYVLPCNHVLDSDEITTILLANATVLPEPR